MTLGILGQTLSGTVTVTRQVVGGVAQTAIQTSGLTGIFGGTTAAPVLTATQHGALANFLITPSGIAGSIAMDVALAPVPGVALTGTFSLDVNTTTAAALGLPAGRTCGSTLPAPR